MLRLGLVIGFGFGVLFGFACCFCGVYVVWFWVLVYWFYVCCGLVLRRQLWFCCFNLRFGWFVCGIVRLVVWFGFSWLVLWILLIYRFCADLRFVCVFVMF